MENVMEKKLNWMKADKGRNFPEMEKYAAIICNHFTSIYHKKVFAFSLAKSINFQMFEFL